MTIGPWLKLDNHFDENRKVVGLTHEAFRLYVVGLCYSSRSQTDGVIAPEMVGRFGIRHHERSADELVAAGLWIVKEAGGWEINDFLEWQRSKAEVEEIRSKRSAAGRKGGRPKAKAKADPNQIGFGVAFTPSNPDTDADTETPSSSRDGSPGSWRTGDDDDDEIWIEVGRLKKAISPVEVSEDSPDGQWMTTTIGRVQAAAAHLLDPARDRWPDATPAELAAYLVNGTEPRRATPRTCQCGAGPFHDVDAFADHLEDCPGVPAT